MRRNRVQKGKGYVGVAIVIAGLDENGEFERAAPLRDDVGESCTPRHGQGGGEENARGDHPAARAHRG